MNNNLVRMSVWIVLAGASTHVCGQPAQEYQGAAAALKQIASPAPAKKPETKDLVAVFRADLATFRAKSLAPQAAAREWLALADRIPTLSRLPSADERFGRSLSFTVAISSIPPPSSWNALAAAISTRFGASAKRSVHSASMLLLGHLLIADREAAWAGAETLHALLSKRKIDESAEMIVQVVTLMEGLAKTSRNPDRILKVVELQMSPAYNRYEGGRGSIPDLVSVIGAKRAELLIRRALLTQKSELQVVGVATGKLARKLALELAPRLKWPQWSLCNSIDSGTLYEAMSKRFPVARSGEDEYSRGSGGQSRNQARTYFMVGLIAAGKTKEASKMYAELRSKRADADYLPTEAIRALQEMGKGKALYTFLHAELVREPGLSLWHAYMPVAAEQGRTDEMLALIRTALQRKGVKASTQALLQERLYQALLAADKVDEGVAQMRKMIAIASKSSHASRLNVPIGIGLDLAKIGKLLQRDALVQEGLKIVLAALDTNNIGEITYFHRDLVNLLVSLNRGPEAEKILIDDLARASTRRQDEFAGPQGRDELVELCGLYHRAGRHRDVLALLDRAPNWFARDLSDILAVSDSNRTPIGYMAATAMLDAGETDRALATLEALLRAAPNNDRGFELFVKLHGELAIPFLDEMISQDRFEDRPLTWKAYALLQAGKPVEAEKAAREAISIDPSDGEQGKGDRMRVYGVLADIREARGDAQQAALFRGAVKAVRMSEDADDYAGAGLLSRAISMYKQSLTFFADAYCIQSRLAINLAAEGRMEEAETHYRRAYELMPESFGRMESHCFGCEKVFKGVKAASVAEKVFVQIAARTPNKPQVHYLLGYLREEQERFGEAREHYRRAVSLDPLYLNAWMKLRALGDRWELPQADIDAATFNILRIDPQRRHSNPDLQGVGDLRLLWTELEAAHRRQAPSTRIDLLPLSGSAAVVDKAEAQFKEQIAESGMDLQTYLSYSGRGMPGQEYERTPFPTPRKALAENKLLVAVAQLIDTEARREE